MESLFDEIHMNRRNSDPNGELIIMWRGRRNKGGITSVLCPFHFSSGTKSFFRVEYVPWVKGLRFHFTMKLDNVNLVSIQWRAMELHMNFRMPLIIQYAWVCLNCDSFYLDIGVFIKRWFVASSEVYGSKVVDSGQCFPCFCFKMNQGGAYASICLCKD